MGNACSKEQQSDSDRVQQDNNPKLDGRPMSIWDYNAFTNPFSEPDNTSFYEKIYLASFYNPQSGYFCGHLFIVGFQRVDGDNEPREYRHSFLFFKFDTKPTKITIQRQTNGDQKQTNGELKISFIGDKNRILFEQVWLSSEYELSEDGSVLRTIVKKKMIVNVSSNVQIDNGEGASALQADVQPLSVNSRTDGSAILASEVSESDNGEGASASQTDVQPLSVDSHDNGSATQASKNVESNPVLALLNHTVSQRFEMSALQTASEALLPVLQSGIVSASNSPATVIRINQPIIFFANVCVNDENLLVEISIPSTVIESMIKFFRAVGPNVLGTVSRLINQLTGLLQLDYKPSKTALVLSDTVCDNGCNFLTSMLHQLRQNISLLERRASSKDSTSWETVERVAPSVEVASSNRSASSTLDLVSSESPEQLCSRQDFYTGIDGVNLVNIFSDKKYNYTVHVNEIKFSIGPDKFSVDFGIQSTSIKNILVYEIEKSLFLIVIHTFQQQVYLSGHSGTSTSPIFVKTQITTHVSVGQPNLFESIEFDSRNVFRFQINMTKCKKLFEIDNQDGSIRQLGCQWKNKL